MDGPRLDPPVIGPDPTMAWCSDAVAEMLRRFDVPYVALTPGSSFRGLHDSLVNHLGNERPGIVVCLHEEHAVAIAHGYAKVTERPMAAALHANVGLMHATMAMFNAYCDRVPMLVLGATGPVDAAARRPWIDWIHTAADQAALVRPYVKWDDQPASATAAVASLAHANAATRTYPCAPVYVCLDAALQEQRLPHGFAATLPDVERHRAPAGPSPTQADLTAAMAMLAGAERPLILIGRTGRGEVELRERVELAERLGARVLTDLKAPAAFPSAHGAHAPTPGLFLTASGRAAIRAADVILALDWIDLAGTLRAAYGDEPTAARVISCSMDHVLHNGWSKDGFGIAPVDLPIAAHPDRLVAGLLGRLDRGEDHDPTLGWLSVPDVSVTDATERGGEAGGVALNDIAGALWSAFLGVATCRVRLPLTWDGADLEVDHPLDFLGLDGGAGLGSGPGIAVGAALALKGTGRVPVAVLGDGDLLMGATALWTAAHHRLPLLVVVANNRSYGNDEIHQARVARDRGRATENRWIGQHIRDPDPDIVGLARSLGLRAHGPIEDLPALQDAIATAAGEVGTGETVLIDVRVADASG